MKIEKNQSGLLLYEDFKEQNLIWLPSPDNYNNIEFTQSGLQIAHSDMYKTITIQKPDEDNFIFSCKINHDPVDTSDIGGVIIISDKKTYIECQSYLANEESYITNADRYEEVLKQEIEKYIDYFVTYSIVSDTGVDPDVNETGEEDPSAEPEPFYDSVYPYIRVICHGQTYSFYASTDNINWIELGSGVLDANRIGFFLYSHNETETPFNVEYAALYSSNYMIINNMPSECTIEAISTANSIVNTVFTEDNVFIKRKENQIYIDTTLIECPINDVTLNIKDNTNNIIYTQYFNQLVGGDTFTVWYDIEMYIDQHKINPNELYDLGMFISELNYIRVDLLNNEEFPVNNIKLEVKKFSSYYVGDENIGIAVYEQGRENYNFKDSVVIDRIEPLESRSYVIGLTNKQNFDFYNMTNDKRFKILLSNL